MEPMSTQDGHSPNPATEPRSATLAAHQDPSGHAPSVPARDAHDVSLRSAAARIEPAPRNLPASEVAAFLRSLVGLPPADGGGADVGGRPMPRTIDAASWIAWTMAGLHACALPEGEDDGVPRRRGPWVPSARTMVREARRVAMVLAMTRYSGNISRAAEALGTSRRALRETLKTAELYPWGEGSEGDEPTSHDEDARHVAVEGADVKGGE